MYVWLTQYGWTVSKLTSSTMIIPHRALADAYFDTRQEAEDYKSELYALYSPSSDDAIIHA